MNGQLVVIGAGASGMAAAIEAARAGANVLILEHMDRVGKKILATGNGRCNLTNRVIRPECYRCGEAEFPMKILRQVSMEETLEFFRGLGILPKDKNGYIYPWSEQASAVLDVLRMELEHLNVPVICDCHVEKIERSTNGGFLLDTSTGNQRAAQVILAAGSRAAPVTGSDGSGYRLAMGVGHRLVKPLPALVQLCCEGGYFKQMSGVRTEAEVTLYVDGKKMASDRGELQLTDYGISGIPTFQISRYASVALDRKQRVTVLVDFLPDQTIEETHRFLEKRIHSMGHKTWEELMTGVLNKKLAQVLLKLAGIRAKELVDQENGDLEKRLLLQMKEFQTVVTKTKSYEQAQVCCGGIDVTQVDPATMESTIAPGLYLAGELLDVDGICGGYNLQWAWSTGILAGRSAAARSEKSRKDQEEIKKAVRELPDAFQVNEAQGNQSIPQNKRIAKNKNILQNKSTLQSRNRKKNGGQARNRKGRKQT